MNVSLGVVVDGSGDRAGGSSGSMMKFDDVVDVFSGKRKDHNDKKDQQDNLKSMKKKHSKSHDVYQEDVAQVIVEDPTENDVHRLVVGEFLTCCWNQYHCCRCDVIQAIQYQTQFRNYLNKKLIYIYP